ncbi:MAG: hypothetical protein PUK70_01725 [Bacteroidales bacterium]|nr:hypothetical protein [Bacteroidales bacterium]MDY6002646.1 hypothetical protein [Candidatus Cryptobacteroides sp.]
MSYTKVSLPKLSLGAGCPTPKSPDIIIIDVDDVVTEPTRSVGNTALVGDITLKASAKAVRIYGTPSTINITEEYSGEDDARGIMQGLEFEHPGNSVEVKNFIEAFLNKGVIAIVKECDGSSAGRMQLFGSKCNPLLITPETTISKESTKRKFTLKQSTVGPFLPGDYSGKLPEIASDATSGSEGA